MATFGKLKVWKLAHELVLEIYLVTKEFPTEEKFALVQQIRRAAVSIAANIAEGSKRRTDRDKTHFYNLADTSLEEVKYYLILSRGLNYFPDKRYLIFSEKTEEIGRMLNGLMCSLN